MKILMLKYYPVAISESFIRDQANLTPDTQLFHGPWPIRYGRKVTFLVRLAWILVKAISRLTDWFYYYLCYRLIKKNQPDLVFIQYGTTAARMYKACLRLGIPFIIHFHGSDAYRKQVLDKYGNTYVDMLKQADAVIAVSKEMSTPLIAKGAAVETVILNPCGIDTNLFQLKSASDHFLSVGRFVPKKAPHHTITAFSKVLKEYPQQKLVMIGDGPLLATCIQLAQKLGIESSIQFLGARDRSVVLQYMQGCFVFLQHSVTAEDGDKEGSPVAIAEAAACGIPVVSTVHAGIPEIVLDGKTGFLVEENDVDEMANRIKDLIKIPSEKYEVMVNNAREHMLNQFDQQKQLEKLKMIIYSIVNK